MLIGKRRRRSLRLSPVLATEHAEHPSVSPATSDIRVSFQPFPAEYHYESAQGAPAGTPYQLGSAANSIAGIWAASGTLSFA